MSLPKDLVVRTIEMHTGSSIRTVVSGFPPTIGSTVLEKVGAMYTSIVYTLYGCLNIPVTRLFAKQPVKTNNKENIKALFYLLPEGHVMRDSINMSRIILVLSSRKTTLQWRNNERDGVSNHEPHDCLLNRLFRRTSKKTSKLRVSRLCVGNSPVTGEFPTQRASYAEYVSFWWRHHDMQTLTRDNQSTTEPSKTVYIEKYALSFVALCFIVVTFHFSEVILWLLLMHRLPLIPAWTSNCTH